MWKFFETNIDECLSQYPTSLEEDIAILETDDKENTLGFNKRNCVTYRKMDKLLLHEFKDTANKVFSLKACKSSKDAIKEVNSWSNVQMRIRYFIDDICPLLDVKQ